MGFTALENIDLMSFHGRRLVLSYSCDCLWITRRWRMAELPAGTVTFLFTDIEGSTRLWEQHPQAMPTALARHDAIMRQAIAQQDGVVYKIIGDAFQAAFTTAPAACA